MSNIQELIRPRDPMSKELMLKILLDKIADIESLAMEKGSQVDYLFKIGEIAGIAYIVRELNEVKDAKSSNN
jgi:hypothetical protein